MFCLAAAPVLYGGNDLVQRVILFKIHTTAMIRRTAVKMPAIPFHIISREIRNCVHIKTILSVCDVLGENRGFKPLHLELQEPGNKTYHHAAGNDRSDLAGNIGSCSVHENDISGIFLHGHFLDDS